MPSGPKVGSAPPGGASVARLATSSASGGFPQPAELADLPSPLLAKAATILSRESALDPTLFGNILSRSTHVMSLPVQAPGASLARSDGHETMVDVDRLRRHLHEAIETLLAAFSPKIRPLTDRVPMIPLSAPVAAGGRGSVTLTITNEEAAPSTVNLYCTNFVADNGYDIPAMRVSFAPKKAIIAPKGETTFEVTVAVPQQAPAGNYSGLIVALGAKYVKTVLLVEVR